MPQQHHVIALQPGEDGRESRVIEHHVTAVGILEAHPDVLPDLEAHRALLERAIHLFERGVDPVRRLEICDGESPANATHPG